MKHFRLFIIVSVVVIVLSSLAGCAGSPSAPTQSTPVESENTSSNIQPFEMELIGEVSGRTNATLDTDKFYYYRDVKTDVIYICFEEYRKGGLTAMLDPDTGLPLTYTRYMEFYNSSECTSSEKA